MVPRGTTPTFVLTVADPTVDLTAAAHVYAAFRQGDLTVTRDETTMDVTEKAVSVYFTQAGTLAFQPDRPIEIQLNWVYADGQRAATEIVRTAFSENLIGSELS